MAVDHGEQLYFHIIYACFHLCFGLLGAFVASSLFKSGRLDLNARASIPIFLISVRLYVVCGAALSLLAGSPSSSRSLSIGTVCWVMILWRWACSWLVQDSDLVRFACWPFDVAVGCKRRLWSVEWFPCKLEASAIAMCVSTKGTMCVFAMR